MRRIAVIGASLAGLSAARALRAQGFAGRLTVIGDEVRRPYDRPPLSKEFLCGELTEADFGARVRRRRSAGRLDTRCRRRQARHLFWCSRTGERHPCRGGSPVVIATGSRARRWHRLRNDRQVYTSSAPSTTRSRCVQDLRARRSAGGHRRRVHRRGGCFHGPQARPRCHCRRGRCNPTPTPARSEAGRRRVRCARHERHVADMRRRRRRLDRRASPPPQYCSRSRHGRRPGRRTPPACSTSSLWVSAVCPTSSGCRAADSRSAMACCAEPMARPPSRTLSRSGTARPGTIRSIGAAHRVEHWTGALERPAIAVATLLAGWARPGPVVKPPYFWSDQYGSRIQFAGLARPDDEITIEEGSCDDHCFLATYRRDGRLVAVLGVNQPRLFTRWRRQLATAPTVV